MNCPICNSVLFVRQTKDLSGSLTRRTRECSNDLCPFVDRTHEMLNEQKNTVLLDEVFQLLRDIIIKMGKGPVKERIKKLSDELLE